MLTQNSNMFETLVDLRNRGFSYLFVIKNERLICKDYMLSFDELNVLEVHCFEIEFSDAYDTLYAVECTKHNIKGIVLNLAEVYANAFSGIILNNIVDNPNFRYQIHSSK